MSQVEESADMLNSSQIDSEIFVPGRNSTPSNMSSFLNLKSKMESNRPSFMNVRPSSGMSIEINSLLNQDDIFKDMTDIDDMSIKDSDTGSRHVR